MKEEFLQYIWSQELFKKEIVADTGDKIEVISPGSHNRDAGPDFQNARIKIGDTVWAGNVEIHIESASWEKHNHRHDPAYDNVILHVVAKNNHQIFNSKGRRIPTIVLDFNKNLHQNYKKLLAENNNILCFREVKLVDDFVINMWLDRLIVERLEEKTNYLKTLLDTTNNSWEDTFYIALARNFGFKTNALPFELLAKSIPLKILSKCRNNLTQLEALLFGQAGFLDRDIQDEYFITLNKEYNYLRNAYKLAPIENHLWKFLRLRPSNFPTIRIAQFATLIHNSQHLFSKTIEAGSINDLYNLYNCNARGYWDNHFNFNSPGKKTIKNLGKTSLTGILINTVIPFLFLYGKLRGIQPLQEKSLDLLAQLPSEKNNMINIWNGVGIKAPNALQTQALLQLINNYCSKKNCLYCQIGNTIIRKQN